MLLGIVSDTHGHAALTGQAVRMLESLEVETVIHCGDIGSVEVVPMFGQWPTHFVFGNVDYDQAALREAIDEAGQRCHGRFGQVELEGVQIAFLHGDDRRRLEEASQCGNWDLVCYGHTHVARHEQFGKTHALNPGAVYRANPHSVAVVALPALEITTVPF